VKQQIQTRQGSVHIHDSKARSKQICDDLANSIDFESLTGLDKLRVLAHITEIMNERDTQVFMKKKTQNIRLK
jgi:hypothetical protein